jgi:hypothetical protein
MLVPEKTSGPSCVTSRPSDSVRMIASLKSERLKTPNEGSKPEFHLRWIRELVPLNASAMTDQSRERRRLHRTNPTVEVFPSLYLPNVGFLMQYPIPEGMDSNHIIGLWTIAACENAPPVATVTIRDGKVFSRLRTTSPILRRDRFKYGRTSSCLLVPPIALTFSKEHNDVSNLFQRTPAGGSGT